MSANRCSILVVDDDDTFRRRLARAFVSRGYDARTACDYDDAIRLAECDRPDLTVVDLRMPGRSGLELIRALREMDPAAKIVMLTGYSTISTAVDAMRMGAIHYLRKPADADEILAAFHGADGDSIAGRAASAQPVGYDRLLGALAVGLSPDDLVGSIERALELLREAAGADDCELFLREPDGGDLLLTACCGVDREALMERDRFPRGVGYPGIVVEDGQSILTRDLPGDRRFLRRSLTASGIHSFVCVPVPGASGAVGTLALAWRDPEAAVERGADLLTHTAGTIGNTIRAGLSAARESVESIIDADLDADARRVAFLDVVIRTAGARGATLVINSEREGGAPTIVSRGGTSFPWKNALVDGKLCCRPLEKGHGVVLGSAREDWPERCRDRLQDTTLQPCCLPIISGKQLRGAVILDYRGCAPTPLTRNMVPLLSMTHEAGGRLLRPIDAHATEVAEPEAAELEVRCIGKFEINLLGEVITAKAFPRKKAIALFKLLLLKRGNPISRDALVDQLWPEAKVKAGANRLHGVVHALRSAIEPDRDKRSWRYIRNEGDLYHFNMESSHRVDLYSFSELQAAAREAEGLGDLGEAAELLGEAFALYRGDLFADDPYVEWCRLERDELRSTFLDMALRLNALCASIGRPERGVEYLRKGLLADPLREDLHQALIQALISLKRRSEALEQYDDCVRLLRDGLGVEPLPETRRLERLVASSLSDA